MNHKLKKQLLKMMDEDQSAGKASATAFYTTGRPSEVLSKKYLDVVSRNVAELKKIIENYGWPGICLVGKDGSEAAWIMAQHADHDIKFQKTVLSLMKKELSSDNVSKENFAYLTDRVLVNEGNPQTYGTQVHEEADGSLSVKNGAKYPNRLDKLRAEVGLKPVKQYFEEYEQIRKNLSEGKAA